MAQRRYRSSALRRTLGRWGLLGGRGVVTALTGLALCATGAGALWEMRPAETVIERAAPAEAGLEEAAGEPGAEQAEQAEQEPEPRYIVHVDGAVAAPGVVELFGADLRVYDAVTAAGGLLEDADTSQVNLAEPLSDGAKIHIPHAGEEPAEQALPVVGQAETSGATGAGGGTALVNINTASVEELQTLSGVGEVTARAIVDEREQNGPYATVEDIMRVSGIGEKKFAKLRDHICV